MIFAVLFSCEVKDGGRRGAFTSSLKEGGFLLVGGVGEGGQGILPQGLSPPSG